MRTGIGAKRFAILGVAVVVVVLLVAPQARAAFILGTASDYAILYEGTGANTLQITNVTINGNVGVGDGGQATDSGPSTINGRIDFSAAEPDSSPITTRATSSPEGFTSTSPR
jgi:hypothetical protein